MFDLIISRTNAVLDIIPFTTAAWAVIGTLILFVWIFSRANRDPHSPVKWEHLIIDSSNDRASPYKMGYLVGGLVSTWIVVTLTDTGKLSYDIFGMYLGYLLGGAGVNTFFKYKGAESTPSDLRQTPSDLRQTPSDLRQTPSDLRQTPD